MNILALNAGSSSLKYKLFRLSGHSESTLSEEMLLEGIEDHSGTADIVQSAERVVAKVLPTGIDGVGYRVVHGGSTFVAPTRMTPKHLVALRTLEFLDPLHNPVEVAMIEAGFRKMPEIPAAAIFDTAFHSTLPETAWRYALPRDISDRLHIRRYGFHGISYSYVSQELLKHSHRPGDGKKMVICHLGSGASVCAVKDGKSIDTSMGMTPVEGLVMGTRSGDVDPGLLLYLQKAGKITVDGLDYLLNHQSGLLGLSGRSNDLRALESAATGGDQFSDVALDVFAYRISKYVGAYCATLDGIDTLAFAGGVGEHSADTRDRVCKRLGYLGLKLSSSKNDAAIGQSSVVISTDDSNVTVWVIPTNEELEIARQTYRLFFDAAVG